MKSRILLATVLIFVASVPAAMAASEPAGAQKHDGKSDKPVEKPKMLPQPASTNTLPHIDLSRFGDKPADEAFGAYQRGLYLTAFNLAKPQAEKVTRHHKLLSLKSTPVGWVCLPIRRKLPNGMPRPQKMASTKRNFATLPSCFRADTFKRHRQSYSTDAKGSRRRQCDGTVQLRPACHDEGIRQSRS